MSSPARHEAVTSGGSRILCPHLATSLLRGDDGSEGSSFGKLEKPGLLEKAATSVSGETWRRQRKAVERAFGGGVAAQRRRHQPSCSSSAKELCSWAEDGYVEDARELAAAVAARGMVTATAGEADADTTGAIKGLEEALLNFFDETLAAMHGPVARALDVACEKALAVQKEGCDTLMQKLRDQGDALDHEEVRANSHSALIAGFQAFAVLLLSCLLELADHPELQAELANEARSKGTDGLGSGTLVSAILKETLRVYPPISGLPRVTLAEATSNTKDAEDAGEAQPLTGTEPVALPAGHYVVVDLLAAAHSGPAQFGDSWAWQPVATEEASSSNSDGGLMACPFGIGPRKCPAATLTLAQVGYVLHALSLEFTWSIPLPKDSVMAWLSMAFRCCARRRGTRDQRPQPPDWRFYITHSPTLAFTRDLPLKFSRR